MSCITRKSRELQAAINLSRLWPHQGKRDDARQLLDELYAWFSEGFDTPDLQEAKALLETLTAHEEGRSFPQEQCPA